MTALLEDISQAERLEAKLGRAYVRSANTGEAIAQDCRRAVIAQWVRLLRIAQAGGSRAAIISRSRDAIRQATSDAIATMTVGFNRVAKESFDDVDESMFMSLTAKQSDAIGLLEDAADDYLEIHDPVKEWAPGRKIHPLPPDPGPARKTRYTGAKERRPSKTLNTKIIKSGKYVERMERWSQYISNEKKVAELIADGVAKGKTVQQIAREIEPHVGNLSSSAMRIARTEAARIHNTVAEMNYAQYGDLIAGYRVINPLDDATRPEHRKRATEKNANGLVGRIYWVREHAPKGAKYFSDDRPGLPDEPNCRCAYVPVLLADEDVVFSKERKKVDDIEHDVSEEELEAYREAERKAAGTEKKARAGIRPQDGDVERARKIDEQTIGTKAYEAAKAKREAAAKAAKKPKKSKDLPVSETYDLAEASTEQGNLQDAAYKKAEAAYRKGLKPEEIVTIERWTQGETVYDIRSYESGKWNDMGQLGEENNKRLKPASDELNAILDKAPKYEGKAYRGMVLDSRFKSDKNVKLEDFKEGSTFSFGATSSMSRDLQTAVGFVKGVSKDVQKGFKKYESPIVFEVKNKTAVDIQNEAKDIFKAQSEVLARKDAQYRIVSVKKVEIKGQTKVQFTRKKNGTVTDSTTIVTTYIVLEEI